MTCHPCAFFTPEQMWSDVLVVGEGCSASGTGECESRGFGKIWLDEGATDSKRISGKYEVDFNGKHVKGEFTAKKRKPSATRICE
jgi:hypothetical protein